MVMTVATETLTASVLLNAAALSVEVIRQIAGEEVSNLIDGENIEGSILADTIAAKIQASLKQHMVG